MYVKSNFGRSHLTSPFTRPNRGRTFDEGEEVSSVQKIEKIKEQNLIGTQVANSQSVFYSSAGGIGDSEKISQTSQIHLNLRQQKIIKDFTPQMVEALGGVDEVLKFPVLKSWNGTISVLTAPVMRAYEEDGTPLLLFCYLKCVVGIVTGEYLRRTKDNKWKGIKNWNGAYIYPSELNLRSAYPIQDGSLEEKYMLNKISRLMNGEPIGVLEEFPKQSKSLYYSSYLKGKEFDSYRNINRNFYEREPSEGTTEIYLYDQGITKEENRDKLLEKFPNNSRWTSTIR